MEKVEDVHKLLNGPAGSKVRLKLSRSGMQFDTTLVRNSSEDSAGKKPAAKPAPASKPPAPAGKKKLTDRERADRCCLTRRFGRLMGVDTKTNIRSLKNDREGRRKGGGQGQGCGRRGNGRK